MAKGAYVGVDNKARKIKSGYLGIDTEIPVYDGEIVTTNITESNIEELFTVVNARYYFRGNNGVFTSTNGGDDDSTANSTWTAKSEMTRVSFDYAVSSEYNYDKLTIVVNGVNVVDAVSGELSGSWAGYLGKGQTLEFRYSKDGSVEDGLDAAVISNIVVVQDKRVQINTESKSVARKIKKAYIGVGGVARPCWAGEELTYYGTITGLEKGRSQLAAATVGNHALFAGGTADSKVLATVDAYDTSLTRTSATLLVKARYELAATTVGDYALFAGGDSFNGAENTVDTYNTSLTKGTATNLSEARYELAATTVGDYALFGGGTGSSATKTVDAYNSSLQRTTPTTLAKARKQLASTTVGNYALFGGGTRTTVDSAVDAYDSSLTRTIATTLSEARYDLAATTVGNYALFAGGYNTRVTNVVDAYDTSLTRTTAIPLSASRSVLSATSIGDYALFAGGQAGTHYSTVDVYDSSLTRTTATSLNVARYALAATTVGNYALFGGGTDDDYCYATVDTFVVA